MSSLYDFLNTELSSSATGGVNTAEGQDPSTVNDGLRQFKQLVAAFIDDLGAVTTVGGTADAITVTLGQVGGANSISAYATGQLFRFKAGADNTGAATINVNAIGAKAIRKIESGADVALDAADILDGKYYLAIYDATANAAAGAWIIDPGSASVAAATTSAAGIVELATQTEAATLTDTSRAVTSDGLFFLGGYTTTATAAGTTTLTVTSTYNQYFTGSTTQTLVLPVTSTLVLGRSYRVVNNSTGAVTVQSSGANTIIVLAPGDAAIFTCILTSGTTAASWSFRALSMLSVAAASLSSTSTEVTGLAAGIRRLIVPFRGLSTSGTSLPQFRIGPSGGVVATGYEGTAGVIATSSAAGVGYTTGLGFTGTTWLAASTMGGWIDCALIDPANNVWAMEFTGSLSSSTQTFSSFTTIALSGALSRFAFTMANGTDTFDAGTFNYYWEI